MRLQMGFTYYARCIVRQTMWPVLNIGWMDLACVFTLCICLETLYLASIAYELVVVVRHSGPLDQEAKSSMTAEWSSSTILYAVVLLSVHVTQCPVSFKGPRSSCQLVFHQWNVSPILCCSSR